MEEKIFTATGMVLPWPWKWCNFTSVTVVVPRLYQQMIWRNTHLYQIPHTYTFALDSYSFFHSFITIVKKKINEKSRPISG